MGNSLIKYGWIVLAVMFVGNVYSQEARITVERDSMLIGEQTTIQIELAVASRDIATVTWPLVENQLSEFIEIVDSTAIDTLIMEANKGVIILRQQFLITSFDSGYYAIQPIVFNVKNDSVSTETKFIYINTVPVNLDDGIKTIRGIYTVPFDWKSFFKRWTPYVLGALALLFLLLYFLKKRGEKEVEIVKEVVIQEPAHVIAYRSLNKLREKELLKKGKEKAYQTELTNILRTYLEDRYNIQAMEQTSGETIKNLKFSSIGSVHLEDIAQVLNMADIVKFAKGHMSQQLNESAFDKVMNLVNTTKATEQEEGENGA